MAAQTAFGQGMEHMHEAMPGMEHHAAPLSAKARSEIAQVAKSVSSFESVDSVQKAGFRPVFGWIPTMGVHWVNAPSMLMGKRMEMTSPNNLMFSRVNGRDSLVGAAYAYYTSVADTMRPQLFDGAPAWHEHTNLALPGQTLVMLHVWFVPSPDGPFAGTNPNLPFWAAGLDAPDSARMGDTAFASRVRRTALALAEITDPASIFPNLQQRRDVRAVLAPSRDSVRALLPELKTALATKDPARFDRVADRVAKEWDAMYAAYLATARTSDGKRRIVDHVAMLMADHGDHGH